MKKMVWVGAGIVCAALIGYKVYADQVVDKQVRAALESQGVSQQVRYDDVSVGLFGGVTFDHVVIGSAGDITFDKVVVSSVDREALKKGELPTYGSVSFNGYELAMTEDRMKKDFSLLYQMGYRDIQGDLNVTYKYSPADKILNIQDVSIAMDELGKVSGKLSLKASLDFLKNPRQLVASLERAKLLSAGLKFENDGLVESGFAMYERQDHKDRDQILSELNRKVQRAPQGNEKKAATAFRDFVDGGHEFGVSIESSSDMPLLRVLAAFSTGDFRGLNLEFHGS
ncbi:hypothetical protein [Mariprofundus sp. KV]|uniref:hypothetical protein n=1 Tax=Mariprofundus sp. KV TaxID=2608715 RepID=UPI0015A29F3D|nr:hypothetical protein [Mariprofundus sp. KV]NWF36185.1 hypothetical protein [Mariprofundus sp. KV]